MIKASAYTEDDVAEAARALTGWVIDPVARAGRLVPRRHQSRHQVGLMGWSIHRLRGLIPGHRRGTDVRILEPGETLEDAVRKATGAAEELGASVGEIARQVEHSLTKAREAVSEADATAQIVYQAWPPLDTSDYTTYITNLLNQPLTYPFQ